MFKKLLFFILTVSMLSGCLLSKPRKLKSPCIQGNKSTACKLYPVNDHWLKAVTK